MEMEENGDLFVEAESDDDDDDNYDYEEVRLIIYDCPFYFNKFTGREISLILSII